MGNVTTQHADYRANVACWQLTEDAAAGERAIKEGREKYLPRPNPKDTTEENRCRYDQYLTRAVYYNATGRTLSSLTGLALGRWPEVNLPAAIEDLKDDVSGSGVTLIQQAQQTIGRVLKAGRAGLLVDFPQTEGDVSRAAQISQGLRPTISAWSACDIINWRTRRQNGRTELELLVLSEQYEEIDEFETKLQTQYRVLRMVGQVYQVEIWRNQKSDDGTDSWQMFGMPVVPKRGDGSPWNQIPFQFVGSVDNDWTVDPAPLYDLAVLNVAHFRNSADYEDSVYLVGQPQFWIAGLDVEWRDHLEKKGIYVGSRSVLTLPANGSAGLLQAEPNTLAKEAMTSKEAQMAALGARLLLASGTAKTATQQDSEDTVAHSVLSLVCDNVSGAYTQALKWYATFANVPEDAIEFSIPTDFVTRKADPAEIEALLKLVQAGKLPESDFYTRLRSAGIIDGDKSDDDIREEIDSQSPTGAGLGDPGGDPTQPPPQGGGQPGAE